jgi:hypothetical protein
MTSPHLRLLRDLLLFVLLVDGPARADEPIRHVVKVGDSCSSIAQRYYGDPRLVDLLHAANPEIGRKPPPHALAEGTILLVPTKPPPKTGPDAELTVVRNQVEVMNPEPKQGKPNDPLFRGNRVSTQASSAADVTFRDETQVKLGERTLVIILGDARAAAAKVDPVRLGTETKLVTGNLRAFLGGSGKAGPANVATEAARVQVYQGEAQVSADEKKSTRVAVYRGSSAVDARGTRREVARGFGSKTELGQSPAPPRPLPPAPAWSKPPPLVLVEAAASPSVIGEWELPSSASGRGNGSGSGSGIGAFHVQLSRDGIFRDVAVDTRVPGTIHRLDLQAPGSGRYYVRVSAIDDDQFEGPFGPIARTLVVEAKRESLPDGRVRIALDPPDAFCVRVGNVTLQRVQGPFLVGTAEPVRLRCAPNDLDPTTLIAVQ